jgi:hypothetical protein
VKNRNSQVAVPASWRLRFRLVGNPVLKIGDSPDEQQGFLALFRGAILAVRNPKAHSLGGTSDAQRALEWLFFASVLLRNLDESTLQQPNS